MAQLQELEQEQSRQVALVASLAQQRDMYRALVVQKNIKLPPELSSFEPLVTSTPSGARPPPRASPERAEAQPGNGAVDDKAALAELQQEFDTFKKEMGENHRMVTEQLERSREDCLQQKVERSKKEAELEFTRERLSLVQSNLDNFMKESAALRERGLQMANTLVQHQQTIATLRQELMVSQEKAARAEVSLESMRAERDQLRSTEARLLREQESLRQEQGSQARILANLQMMQLNLDRMDAERKEAASSKVRKLELEIESLGRQLESQREQQASLAAVWERQVAEAGQRADREAAKATKSQDELVEAYAQLHQARQQLSQAQSQTHRSEGSPADASQVATLKSLLAKSQDQIKELQGELEVARKYAESLKKLASDAESRLAEQDAASAQLKQLMQESLQEASEVRQNLEERVANLESLNHELGNEKLRILEEKRQQVEALQGSLSAAGKELEQVQRQVEDKARQDAEQLLDQDVQSALVKQAQEKYERELLLHAADIEALSTARSELSSLQLLVSGLKERAAGHELALEEGQRSWAEREERLRKENEGLSRRSEELERQNALVHQQLEMLSSQVCALQQKKWEEVSPEEGDRSSEQLMEVMGFLRKEKELFANRAEVAQAETVRLKVQLEHSTAQLRQLEKDLKEEHDRALARASSDTQHSELLKKVEMVNILSESNRLLRDEKEQMSDSQKQLQAKVRDLECRLEPLQTELRAKVAQAEVLQGDVGFLRGEVQRWQQRTNQLLEQSSRTDPEAFRRLAEENTKVKQEAHTLTEELQSAKAQLAKAGEEAAELRLRLNTSQEELASRLNSFNALLEEAKKMRVDLPQLRKELLSARAEGERQKGEAIKMAAELEALRADKEEKLKTIVQVKKIARRYRSQHEELMAEKQALTARSKELEAKVAELEQSRAQARPDTDFKELEEKLTGLTEELEKTKAEVTRLAAERDQANVAGAKAKGLIVQARKRIAELNTKIEELTRENQSLKENLETSNRRVSTMEQSRQESGLRESTIRSQFEGRLVRQDRELREAKDALDKAHRQVEDLTQKLAQQQQKQAKPTMVTAPVERTSHSGGVGEPMTANVRPLTPPVQAPPMRQGPSASTGTTRLTPTASIRPMAQARLAAVLPTIPASQAASEEVHPAVVAPVVAPVVADVQVTPTVVVTPVQETATPEEPEETAPEPAVTPAVVVPSITVTPVVPTLSQEEASEAGADEPEEPAPAPPASPSPPVFKRQRESTPERASESPVAASASEIAPSSKRPRIVVTAAEEVEKPSTSGEAVEQAVTEAQVRSPIDLIVVESDDEAIEEEKEDAGPQKPAETSEGEKEESGMEEEECEYEEMNVNYVVETEESMPVEDLDQDIAEQEAIEEGGVAQEGDMDEPGEPNEVEIVDLGEEPVEDREMEEEAEEEEEPCLEEAAEEEEQRPPQQPPSQQQPPQQQPQQQQQEPWPAPGSLGAASRVPLQRPSLLPRSRSERLPSSQSGFEEGDDSIVPSTPTLFVPRRGDGFAEAVSSPHVPHGGFVFGGAPDAPSTSETSGLSQLASQEGVGVDDTRMDLSHFEEGGGRSVPSTPLQISPPESRDASLFQADVAVVEVSEPPEDGAVDDGNQEPLDMSAGERSVPATVIEEAPEADDRESATVVPVIEEPESEESGREESAATPSSSGISISAALSLIAEESNEEEESAQPPADVVEVPSQPSSEPPPTGSATQQQQQQQQTQPQRRRIVWKDPEPATPVVPAVQVASPVAPAVAHAAPAAVPALLATPSLPLSPHFSPPPQRGVGVASVPGQVAPRGAASRPPLSRTPVSRPPGPRGQRGRRVRLRGMVPQGRGSPMWGPNWRGGRGGQGGRGARGEHHF